MEDSLKPFPKRKRNRMDGYDYSLCGAYFVTICLKNRERFLWENVGADNIRANDTYELSEYGKIVEEAVKNISTHYPSVIVDEYVIMPDHIHMVIFITESVNIQTVGERIALPKDYEDGRDLGKSGRAMRAPTISTVINQMKGAVTKAIGFPIWQKSFHDHIIRNENDYNAIRKYIYENPAKYLYNEHSS